MAKKRTTAQGGSRKGAGRKPVHGERTRSITISVPESFAAAIERLAEANGVSRSVAATDVLEIGLKTLREID